MSKILMLSIFLFLTACSHQGIVPVEIIGKNPDNSVSVRGMGIWDNSILITSAHVVRYSDLSYFDNNQPLRIEYIDYPRDRAFLSLKNNASPIVKPYEFVTVSNGDLVSVQVLRNHSMVTLTGRVIDASGSVLGYDTNGRIIKIQGIVLTDIDFIPGDSGAPIYNQNGALIDLVHVQ